MSTARAATSASGTTPPPGRSRSASPSASRSSWLTSPLRAAASSTTSASRSWYSAGRAVPFQGDLDGGPQRGQRAAQLVGGVGDEIPLPGQVVGQAVEEAVDRGGQLVQLVAGAAERQPLGQGAGPQPVGGAR